MEGIRRAKEGRTRIRDFGIGATAQGLGYHFSLAQELFFFQEITYVKEQRKGPCKTTNHFLVPTSWISPEPPPSHHCPVSSHTPSHSCKNGTIYKKEHGVMNTNQVFWLLLLHFSVSLTEKCGSPCRLPNRNDHISHFVFFSFSISSNVSRNKYGTPPERSFFSNPGLHHHHQFSSSFAAAFNPSQTHSFLHIGHQPFFFLFLLIRLMTAA